MTKNNHCKNLIDLSKVFAGGLASGQEMPT